MKVTELWCVLLIMIIKKAIEIFPETNEITAENSFVLPPNNAKSFSVFQGEIAYVNDKKFIVEGNEIPVSFNSLQSYIKTEKFYYVCPSDKNSKLVKINIKDSTLTEIELPFTQAANWELKCVHYSAEKAILVSFIGFNNTFAYRYEETSEGWDSPSDPLSSKFGIFTENTEVIDLVLNGDDLYLLNAKFKFDKCTKTVKNDDGQNETVQSICNEKTVVNFKYCKLTNAQGRISAQLKGEGSTDNVMYNSLTQTINLGVEIESSGKIHGYFSCFTKGSVNAEFYDFHLQASGSTYNFNYNVRTSDFNNIFENGNSQFTNFYSSNGAPYFIYYHQGNYKYWGSIIFMVNSRKELIFNNNQTIEAIYPIYDMDEVNLGLITVINSVHYVICPFAGSSKEIARCAKCKDQIIYDSVTGNKCFTIPESKKANFNNIYGNYYKCKTSGSVFVETGDCETCTPPKYLKLPQGECIEETECVNSEKDKTKTSVYKCIDCHHYRQYFLGTSCTDTTEGFYANESNEQVKCDETCKSCENGESCTVCAEGYFHKDITTKCTPCYSSCKTCKELGDDDDNKCMTCKSGFTFDSGNCKCPDEWYQDDDNKIKCITGCPSNMYLIESKKQCVNSCASSKLFAFDGDKKCLEDCPEGFNKNKKTYTCDEAVVPPDPSGPTEPDEPDEPDDPCSLVMDYDENLILDSNIKEKTKEKLDEFLQTDYVKNKKTVKIIYGRNLSLTLYKDPDCAREFSKKNSISYSDLSNVTKKFEEESDNSDFIIGQLEFISEQSEAKQISGFVITDDEGNPYDLSTCAEQRIQVSYPVVINDEEKFSQGEKLSAKGIDIYDSSDSFYNDFCYPYYDDNGKDVTLEDRRKNYFYNGSFCDEGCDYLSFDFKSARVKCECSVGTNILDKINNKLPQDDFPIKLNLNNLIVIRCYNLVFNKNYLKKNIGFWIIFCLVIIQICITITFFTIGLPSFKAFLFHKIGESRRIEKEIPLGGNEVQSQNNIMTISTNHFTNNNSNTLGKTDDIQEIPEGIPEVPNENQEPNPNPPRRTERSNTSIETSKTMNTNEQLSSPSLPTAIPIALIHASNHKALAKCSSIKLSLKTDKPHLEEIPEGRKMARRSTKRSIKKKSTLTFLKDDSSPTLPTIHPSSKRISTYTRGISEKGEGKDESFSSEDLNKMEYEDALNLDSRTFGKFFTTTLFKSETFTSPFIDISPLEPIQFKLIGMTLILVFYLGINAMLYQDKYISSRYESEDTDFLYFLQNELSKSVYASICTCAVGLLITFVTSFKRRFEIMLKQRKTEDDYLSLSNQIIKKMKIRLIIFLIIDVIIVLIFWYYVSAFCAMYQKSQGPFLLGCFITILLCSFWQALIALLVSGMRFIGLRCHISCFYTLSTYFS